MLRHVVLLLFFVLMTTVHGSASTVLQRDLAQVASGSRLIFDGVVVSVQNQVSPSSGMPFTMVTFQVIEVVAGSHLQNRITLAFMGGVKDGYTMEVGGVTIPKMGERGIYFAEDPDVEMVNPLYGWHQGHYLVIPDPGGGPARVVRVDSGPGAMQYAPDIDQFKSTIRDTRGGRP